MENRVQNCPQIGVEVVLETTYSVFQVLFFAKQPREEDIQLFLCDPELVSLPLQTLRLKGGVTYSC